MAPPALRRQRPHRHWQRSAAGHCALLVNLALHPLAAGSFALQTFLTARLRIMPASGQHHAQSPHTHLWGGGGPRSAVTARLCEQGKGEGCTRSREGL